MEFPFEIEPGVELRRSKIARYRLVFPVRNKDGSFNWFNLITGGSWWNLIIVSLIVMAIVVLTFSYAHDIKECSKVMKQAYDDPCLWCRTIQPNTKTNSLPQLNLSLVDPLLSQ